MSNKLLTAFLFIIFPFTVSMGGKDIFKSDTTKEEQKPVDEQQIKIQKLKEENLELLDSIVIKKDTVTQYHQVKVAKPTPLQEETIYVRVHGKVYEFKAKRDPEIKSFILDIDCKELEK